VKLLEEDQSSQPKNKVLCVRLILRRRVHYIRWSNLHHHIHCDRFIMEKWCELNVSADKQIQQAATSTYQTGVTSSVQSSY